MAERELMLLRHGIAEPRGPGVEDGLRPLTSEGRERTQRICQRVCQLGLTGSCLVSSPLLRARQTAEIALNAGLAPTLAFSNALTPGADPWPFLQEWWGEQGADRPHRLILVGHEPDLGQLACRLISAPDGAVALKKAGMALLSWAEVPSASSPQASARLLLLLTPKVLLGG